MTRFFPDISLIFSKSPDISLTAVKFPDISRFSRQVVTLFIDLNISEWRGCMQCVVEQSDDMQADVMFR